MIESLEGAIQVIVDALQHPFGKTHGCAVHNHLLACFLATPNISPAATYGRLFQQIKDFESTLHSSLEIRPETADTHGTIEMLIAASQQEQLMVEVIEAIINRRGSHQNHPLAPPADQQLHQVTIP